LIMTKVAHHWQRAGCMTPSTMANKTKSHLL
jgi:hypothetical protein